MLDKEPANDSVLHLIDEIQLMIVAEVEKQVAIMRKQLVKELAREIRLQARIGSAEHVRHDT